MIEQGDLAEFTSAVGRFSDSADRLLRSGATVANVNVNAGGAGVWIAVTCALMMLSATVVGSLWMSRELTRVDARAAEQEVKLDRANTFLSAIWAQAPELEKKIKADKEADNAE